MIERTFVAIKPDGVKRGLVGKIIQRFEDAGLKIVAMKLAWIDKEFAKQHYTEDIAVRRGEHVRNWLLDFITQGPVVAMVLEGVEAIEVVRKMVGSTEPKSAAPGTIRGDFTHVSFGMADKSQKTIPNVVHASGDKKDAEHEIALWFDKKEIQEYSTVHEMFTHMN
ncbi:MAG: nucleoside-diphosphate kinase [Nanoarchaeota archaeon]|nr:nucleoside-diphosphate kinase [Nanoarchaeota archaeon]